MVVSIEELQHKAARAALVLHIGPQILNIVFYQMGPGGWVGANLRASNVPWSMSALIGAILSNQKALDQITFS